VIALEVVVGKHQRSSFLLRAGRGAVKSFVPDRSRVGNGALHAMVQAMKLLLRQFASPLVLVLVFGAAVSAALGNWLDAGIILAIVLGSALLGFAQEYRANAAVAALKKRLALTAQVERNGEVRTVPATEVVPGDVVRLAAGNLVPADGTVLEAKDFMLVEAALTGESFPVEKGSGEQVYLGTSVRSGTARVRITAIGRDTRYGAVAARLEMQAPEPEFARGVRQFGYLLMRVMLLMVIFVITVNQFLGRPVVESLLFAVALAVGLTPELLPAIVTVTLARGAREMARRGAIVRRLEAIEDLGGMDVLCTDKTGTLTEGKVSLARAVDSEGQDSERVLRVAYWNAEFETGIENPLDAALVAAGEKRGYATAGLTKVDEIPYDFVRKRLTIVLDDGDPEGHLAITKGAFDHVLALCAIHARDRLDTLYRRWGEEGLRVLAVASKRVPRKGRYSREDERDMTLEGLLLFFDPPKPDAKETLATLAGLGIRTKIITGDNRYVAAHVGQLVGLDPQAMLTGEQLAGTKDEALWQLAPRTDLFVEIDPQQKERIVRALQHAGHDVGYLGDGINDAPALHAADVGISVDSAVDVARESADVVLLASDLGVLRAGVEEGRRSFANTIKYINITTSANFGNMISMALVTPLLPFLPLAAKQILLNNFVTDLPSVAISTDRVDEERVVASQRWNVAEVRHFMIVFGLVSSVFDILTFALLFKIFHAGEALFQTAWFVVSVLTELAVVFVLRTSRPAWTSAASPLLTWSSIAVGAAVLALPYAGWLADALGFVPLPATLLGAALVIVAAYVGATEATKLAFYRRNALSSPRGKVCR
jgi:Mg2+-importing ATPase